MDFVIYVVIIFFADDIHILRVIMCFFTIHIW